MSKIPTAFEFIHICLSKDDDMTTGQMMIEFAKLHVEAQQKAIIENVTIDDIGSPNTEGEWMPCNIINKDSIINAYSLDNIK
jgi:hypothetical protein